MKIALVGLPGSGKTTLFCALSALEHVEPSHRIHEPLVATIAVPDGRLEVLRDHFQPKKFTPATLVVEDFPGFPVSDTLEGKSRYLAAIREADAFALVLSAFPSPGGTDEPDAVADRERIMDELALGDLTLVEKRIEKLRKDVQRPSKTRDDDRRELAVLERIHPALYDGQTIRDVDMSDEESRLLRGFGFLTAKPRLIVVNHADDADPSGFRACAASGEQLVPLVAHNEKELACLEDEAERGELMEMLGISEIARPRLLRAAYETLGLAGFFTVGEDEVRAWTIPRSCAAVEAAGKVHSDIQRGFIRAEVVAYDDYLSAGGLKEAKAKNAMRLEGKEYPVADGDIINFRFSV